MRTVYYSVKSDAHHFRTGSRHGRIIGIVSQIAQTIPRLVLTQP